MGWEQAVRDRDDCSKCVLHVLCMSLLRMSSMVLCEVLNGWG